MDTTNNDKDSIPKIQKILVAIDGSKQSIKAAYYAAYLARQDVNINLTLLYVVDINKQVSAFDQLTTSGYIPLELKREGFRILYKLKNKLTATGKVEAKRITASIRMGKPQYIIEEMANKQIFDGIVMGRRGRSKYKSFLLGSVSLYILQNVHCPVLIVND